MRIIQVLPELDIGGVERHVIDLSNELAERGHDVLVISNGGQMQSQLSDKVLHLQLPVHKKNPFIALCCSGKISSRIKSEGWELIHAHSRVPAWIALWASRSANIRFVVTAHVDFGNKNPFIYYPYRRADRVICVSTAVKEGMKNCFYENAQVILNGLDDPKRYWSEKSEEVVKLLFVGRLSPVKGLHDVLRALPQDLKWTLDVLGDGPQRKELESLAKELQISDRVFFRGYSDMVDHYMANSSCLLFPSYTEGMPLTLARAVQIGIPVIASDIPSVTEMAGSKEGLVPPGDIPQWHAAIKDFICTGRTKIMIPVSNIPTLKKMIDSDEAVYEELINSL